MICFMLPCACRGLQDTLPEWSKGVDSSSTSASCVGSKPTSVIAILLLVGRLLGVLEFAIVVCRQSGVESVAGNCSAEPLCLLRLRCSTHVGFKPTRGDPSGLAGRRLNHLDKVSLRTVGLWNLGCALASRLTLDGPALLCCCVLHRVRPCSWVHSSEVRAADCRSAGF